MAPFATISADKPARLVGTPNSPLILEVRDEQARSDVPKLNSRIDQSPLAGRVELDCRTRRLECRRDLCGRRGEERRRRLSLAIRRSVDPQATFLLVSAS